MARPTNPSTNPMNPFGTVPTEFVRPRQGGQTGDPLNIARISDATAGGLAPGAGETPACEIQRRLGRC
jgi:hypothetical protein